MNQPAIIRSRSLYRLTQKQVENVKPSGKDQKIPDGGGLFLRVTAAGTKRWSFRRRMVGRPPRDMGLGSAEQGGVSLKQARELADAARTLAAAGIDPIDSRKADAAADAAAKQEQARQKTFEQYFRLWLAPRTQGLSAKTAEIIKRRVEMFCGPLMNRKLKTITSKDVLSVLQPIWFDQNVTANRLRRELKLLFDHARQMGEYIGENPADWALHSAVLSKPRKLTTGHFPALPWREMPDFIAELRQRTGLAALALEFLILAAARTGEVVHARWSEIDRDQRLWTIPAARMKMGKDHAVVLTERMLAILDQVEALVGTQPADAFIWPGEGAGGNMSNWAMLSVLKRMKRNEVGGGAAVHAGASSSHITVHGFRSSFRDWAGSATHYPRELAEDALAHAVGGVEGSYRREQAVEKRRSMMAEWQGFCDGRARFGGISDKVIVLNNRAR